MDERLRFVSRCSMRGHDGRVPEFVSRARQATKSISAIRSLPGALSDARADRCATQPAAASDRGLIVSLREIRPHLRELYAVDVSPD